MGWDLFRDLVSANGGIIVNAGAGEIEDHDGNTSTFIDVVRIEGSQYNDLFNGTGDGDDEWVGMAGGDTFNGGDGNGWDQVDYEAEEEIDSILKYPIGTSQYGIFVNQSDANIDLDTYTGIGAAIDDFLGDRTGSGGFVNAGKVRDTFDDIDTLNGIEEVKGTNRADVFVGSDDRNQYLGRGGNDWMFGGDDDDRLEGGVGDDHVNGGSGDDEIMGGSGADDIDGGAGRDELVFNRNEGSATGLTFLFDDEDGTGTVGLGTVIDRNELVALGVSATFTGVEAFIGTNSVNGDIFKSRKTLSRPMTQTADRMTRSSSRSLVAKATTSSSTARTFARHGVGVWVLQGRL